MLGGVKRDARIQFPADTHALRPLTPRPLPCDRWQPDWVKEQLAAERETCEPDWFLAAALRFLKLTAEKQKTNIKIENEA